MLFLRRSSPRTANQGRLRLVLVLCVLPVVGVVVVFFAALLLVVVVVVVAPASAAIEPT